MLQPLMRKRLRTMRQKGRQPKTKPNMLLHLHLDYSLKEKQTRKIKNADNLKQRPLENTIGVEDCVTKTFFGRRALVQSSIREILNRDSKFAFDGKVGIKDLNKELLQLAQLQKEQTKIKLLDCDNVNLQGLLQAIWDGKKTEADGQEYLKKMKSADMIRRFYLERRYLVNGHPIA